MKSNDEPFIVIQTNVYNTYVFKIYFLQVLLQFL